MQENVHRQYMVRTSDPVGQDPYTKGVPEQ